LVFVPIAAFHAGRDSIFVRLTGLPTFVAALNRAPSSAETQQTASTELMAKAKRRWVIWDTLSNNRLW
jgi:hypothetical protein